MPFLQINSLQVYIEFLFALLDRFTISVEFTGAVRAAGGPKKRIPSFIYGITSVIQRRF